MPPRFAEKVALITGSSFGIGRGTALLFAQEGAKVTVTGRNEQRLQDTRKVLLDAGVPEANFLIIRADITSPESQDLLISETLKKFGKLDILVNNAGASIPDSEGRWGITQSLETYDKDMELNVKSVIAMTQKARPHLIKTKGEIVNVSSIVAVPVGYANIPYYAVSKAALDQYSRASAISLIADGVRVNSVNPGFVATGFFDVESNAPEGSGEAFYESLGKESSVIPCGFTGRVNDIANVIAYLADRTVSAYIVGQNIIADGGTTLVLGVHGHFARLGKEKAAGK